MSQDQLIKDALRPAASNVSVDSVFGLPRGNSTISQGASILGKRPNMEEPESIIDNIQKLTDGKLGYKPGYLIFKMR
jgi:hypothetical protein